MCIRGNTTSYRLAVPFQTKTEYSQKKLVVKNYISEQMPNTNSHQLAGMIRRWGLLSHIQNAAWWLPYPYNNTCILQNCTHFKSYFVWLLYL